MKKFKFRLERVQRLRERTLEQRKLALAEAIQFRGRVESQIAQLEQTREQEREQTRQELAKPTIVIEEAIRGRIYDSLLGRFGQRFGEQLAQVNAVVAQRRNQLIEAEKSVRILEKIEEKLKRRYDQAVEHGERELMDELALIADQRRRSEGGD